MKRSTLSRIGSPRRARWTRWEIPLGLASAALIPGSALAHPDHASGAAYGWSHLLTDPFHLLLAAGACALAFACRRGLRRARAQRRP